MKQILVIIISLCCVQGFAQDKTEASVDTILHVPLSRVRFCVSKAQEVVFLNERLLVKDQQIVLANNLVEEKNKEIGLINQQLYSVESQRDINAEIIVKKDGLLKTSNGEIKRLKKQNLVLKIGLGLSWILTVAALL